MSGPACDHGDTGLAGQAPPAVRHMHSRGFVPYVDQLDLGLQRCVEERHDMVAG